MTAAEVAASKVEEAAAAKRAEAERQSAKAAEEAARKIIGGIARLRNEVLGLFAVFTAGRGVKQLVNDITEADAATGRLATNVGLSAADLATWQGAAQRTGGSATATGGAIEGLANQFQQLALTGQSSAIPYLRALGVSIADAAGRARPITDVLLDLNRAVQGMEPARANAFLRGIGLDQGTINLVRSTPADLRRLLEEQRRLGVVNDADAGRAVSLQRSLMGLEQRGTSFARAILSNVSPAIVGMLERIGAWIDRNRGWLEERIGAGIRSLIAWLQGIDWDAIWGRAERFGNRLLAILTAIGNWSPPAWMRGMLGLGAPAAPDAPDAPAAATPPNSVNTPLGAVTLNPSPTGRTGIARLLGNLWHPPWAMDNGRTPGSPAAPGAGAAAPPATATPGSVAAPSAAPAGGPTPISANPSPEDRWYTPLLNALGRSEGTDRGRGYNETLAYGRWTGGNVDLTGMTLNQIDALQQSMLRRQADVGIGERVRSSALGRYQFTQTTLRDMTRRYGLNGNMLFDERMQDRLAALRIQMQGGLGRGVRHDQQVVAGIWASAPDPDTGRSHYGQRTGISSEEIQDILRAIGEARMGAGMRQAANDGGGPVTNTHDGRIQFNGPMTVNTQARDARGLVTDLRREAARSAMVAQANTGLG